MFVAAVCVLFETVLYFVFFSTIHNRFKNKATSKSLRLEECPEICAISRYQLLVYSIIQTKVNMPVAAGAVCMTLSVVDCVS